MRKYFLRLLRFLAHEKGRAVGLYRSYCQPDGLEWAAFLRRHGGFYQMGEHCSIQMNVTFTDPGYVRLGNNVRLSGCIFFGHDGSVNMLNRAYGCKLDKVGKVDLRDNVFVGHGAIVLPGVTIGPNAIVAAGSVVSRDVPPNSIVAGAPAKVVGNLDEYVERMKSKSEQLPWYHLILARKGDYDPELQKELDRIRIETFFGSSD